jgi:hypothetical protein
MRRSAYAVLATTALAFTALTGEVRPAAAEQPVIEALQRGALPTSYLQYRRFGPRYGYRPRYGYYGGPYGRYYRRGSGAAAAGVIGGLAAGAIIGGAIAQSQAQAAAAVPVVPADDAVAYCMQRFRSYDPASGTYVGYDGIRRPCP